VIEDNVFIGISSIILKGVRIGENTIIGAGSVVTHDIPPNLVAAGNPCKVIMTLEQYRDKRKRLYVDEAKAYALELYRKKGKVPCKRDFMEEFVLYYNPNEKLDLVQERSLFSNSQSVRELKPIFASFESFLIAAGIPASEIAKSRKQKFSLKILRI
jgi:acyl-[acyl carrier protein]--UDP-N-acetylglucosamine O-acyltransferase